MATGQEACQCPPPLPAVDRATPLPLHSIFSVLNKYFTILFSRQILHFCGSYQWLSPGGDNMLINPGVPTAYTAVYM